MRGLEKAYIWEPSNVRREDGRIYFDFIHPGSRRIVVATMQFDNSNQTLHRLEQAIENKEALYAGGFTPNIGAYCVQELAFQESFMAQLLSHQRRSYEHEGKCTIEEINKKNGEPKNFNYSIDTANIPESKRVENDFIRAINENISLKADGWFLSAKTLKILKYQFVEK